MFRKIKLGMFATILFRISCNGDSSVGIGTALRAGRQGFDFRQAQGILFATASRWTLEPIQTPIRWVPSALSPGVKQPEREADHSPSSSAEVKNACSYISTSICLHGVVLS
jgi:hypothetical protein